MINSLYTYNFGAGAAEKRAVGFKKVFRRKAALLDGYAQFGTHFQHGSASDTR